MEQSTHYKLVWALKKPAGEIIEELDVEQADCLHMTLGIAGEAGEIVDVIKAWTMYQKPLDRNHLIEELGDLEFYLEGLRQRLSIDREEVLQANIDKLQSRYHEGKFTNQQAQARADKQ